MFMKIGVFMDVFFPKDICMIIWEYKHSAEMYDIAQEYKRWFYVDGYIRNLYKVPAFNHRPKICSAYIYNIFQPNCHRPVGILCFEILCHSVYSKNDLENYKNFWFETKNWRQLYIDKFNL